MAKEKEETEISEQDWKTPVIVIAVIVGVALIIGAVIFSNSNLTGNVVNEGSQDSQASGDSIFKKNCRQEQVPYEEQETYYETMPYTDQECNTRYLEDYAEEFSTNEACTDWSFWGTTCLEKIVYCTYKLKNIDTTSGTWTIGMKLKNLDLMSEVNLGEKSQNIPQSVTKTFEWTYSTNRGEDSFTCEITNYKRPTTQECQSVTKYKDVARTRTVTKYKTEEVCD